MTERVFNVLFLCTGNTARSILAEAILRKDGAGRFNAFSAGSQPKGEVNPFALKVLTANDYPTEGLRSKSWEEYAAADAPKMDFVFTVCDGAAGESCPLWPGQPMTAHWGIEDPAAVEGAPIEKERAFNDAFRLMRNRITAFAPPPEEPRPIVADPPPSGDRTAFRRVREGESMMFDLPRRVAAEALGTALLVATVVGSGIMAESLTRDVALALLGNTLATGAMLVVLITCLGPISGAHFNPVVSLVFALRRELPSRDLGPYTLAQIVGGLVGAVMAHAMFALPLLDASLKVRTGASQWFAEGVATFGLLLTILAGIRFDKRGVPWLVGLYITAAYWFTASTSFANPAVTVARALSNTFSGIRPADAPGFIVAQILGALVAAGLAKWLLQATGMERSISEEAKL